MLNLVVRKETARLYNVKRVMVHKLYDAECEARLNSVNWYYHGMQDGKVNSIFLLFSDES